MHRFTWRQWAHSAKLAGVTLALACPAALLPTSASAADLPVVRFQDYPGTGNLMIRVARSKGWCQEAGIVCELKRIPEAPLGLQALVGGSIDVAQAPYEVVAAAVARGGKIKVVVGSVVSNIVEVIASDKLSLPHEKDGYPAVMQDLKGKKIGVVSRGSGSEAIFRYLMQQAGQDPNSVTYVAVGAPNTAFAALRNHLVDAIENFEPAGTMCEITKTCRVIFRGATAKQPTLFPKMYGAGVGLVMTDKEIAAHPEIAHAVVKISQRAAAFINDRANENEVLKISLEYSSFDIPQGNEIIKHILDLGLKQHSFEPMVKRSAVEATLEYYKEAGQINKLPPLDDLIWKDAPAH